MGAFIRRFLLTACCLVLLLPPGWCNFVCVPDTQSKQESLKKTHGGCCDMCRCNDRAKPPPEPKHPTPPSRCCCYELDLLKPNPPEKPVVDLSQFAVVISEDAASTCGVVQPDLGLCIPGPFPPRHLLKCVWLC